MRLTGRDGALGKLTSAEKNDAQNWLPASAESTQVLQMQSQAQSADIIPAVVVYDRPSGVTAADQAKAAADAEAFTRVSGVVDAQIAGPQAARDGQAIQTIVPVNVGKDGWDRRPPQPMSCARSRTQMVTGSRCT